MFKQLWLLLFPNKLCYAVRFSTAETEVLGFLLVLATAPQHLNNPITCNIVVIFLINKKKTE